MPGEGGLARLPADPWRGVQLRPDVRLGEAGRQSALVEVPQGGPCGHREARSLQQKCENNITSLYGEIFLTPSCPALLQLAGAAECLPRAGLCRGPGQPQGGLQWRLGGAAGGAGQSGQVGGRRAGQAGGEEEQIRVSRESFLPLRKIFYLFFDPSFPLSWRLAGSGCDGASYTVFTRISHYLPWIADQMGLLPPVYY